MPRLFHKSMQAHERAYREGRADEAANDMVLGAKLAALNSMEEAQDKAIGDIASQYSKFLKALAVKDVPLASKDSAVASNPKDKPLKAKAGNPVVADVVESMVSKISGSTGPTASLTDISRYSRDARTAQLVATNTRTQAISDTNAYMKAYEKILPKEGMFLTQVANVTQTLSPAQYTALVNHLAKNSKQLPNTPKEYKLQHGNVATRADILTALEALKQAAEVAANN